MAFGICNSNVAILTVTILSGPDNEAFRARGDRDYTTAREGNHHDPGRSADIPCGRRIKFSLLRFARTA